MPRFREHRGTFAESILTTVRVASLAELRDLLRTKYPTLTGEVAVEAYANDAARGWPDTHVVTVDGCAIGFTDGPVS